MISKNVRLKDVESIKVKIFTIGKDSSGESNVFLLIINNEVEYSVVIDSCEKNLKAINEMIIEKYEIEKFDMICWTHPHMDHSKGMLNLMKKYGSSKTKIVLPSELSIVKGCMPSEARSIYKYIQGITKGNSTDKGIYVNATKGTQVEYFELSGEKTIVFEIITLAPIPVRLLNMANNCKHELGKKCNHNFNEYSIVLLIRVGTYFFLFTGDAENEAIDEINKMCDLDNVLFTKIPHHGSDTSDKLVDLFDKDTCKNMLCATTALLKKGEFNNNLARSLPPL